MTTALPILETTRLIIRPFEGTDLDAAHRVLSAAWGDPPTEYAARLPARERWLAWAATNHQQLAALDQPPYGDRAIILREGNHLIGSVGLVPAFGPFRQLPGFPDYDGGTRKYPEVGLLWAVDPAYQRRGYATEAARALIDRAFDQFALARMVATTEYTNEPSMAVMRHLGMRLLRNPLPTPPWFQVIGLLTPQYPRSTP